MIYRQKWITRQNLRDNREWIYVFGDNFQRLGFGGQAREMRGEPNALGLPTKHAPDNDDKSFFSDAVDHSNGVAWLSIIGTFNIIDVALKRECCVVIPLDGLGTGLSELPTRAPKINRLITSKIEYLEFIFGTKQINY